MSWQVQCFPCFFFCSLLASLKYMCPPPPSPPLLSALVGPPHVAAFVFGFASVEQVVVTVQFPKVVRTADLHVSSGTCLFDEALKVNSVPAGVGGVYVAFFLPGSCSVFPVLLRFLGEMLTLESLDFVFVLLCLALCVGSSLMPAIYMRARAHASWYAAAAKVAKWNLGKLFKDKSATMTGTLSIQGPKPEESPPVQLSWKVRRRGAALRNQMEAIRVVCKKSLRACAFANPSA